MKYIKALLKAISIFFQSYNKATSSYQPDPSYNLTSKSSYTSTLRIGTLHSSKPLCPNCGIEIKKHPLAKTKCKSCGLFMFKRTRPVDNNQVTVTEKEAELIDIEWQKVSGTYETIQEELKRESTVTRQLSQKSGIAPTKDQVRWQLISDDIEMSLSSKDWGLYVSAKREAALYLNKAKHYRASMLAAFEVCHYDNNQMYNAWDRKNNEFVIKHSDGKISECGIAGGIVGVIAEAARNLNLSKTQVKELYFDTLTKITFANSLPISLTITWNQIENWPDYKDNV